MRSVAQFSIVLVMVGCGAGDRARSADQVDTVMVFVGQQGKPSGYNFAAEVRTILQRAEAPGHTTKSSDVLVAMLSTPGNSALKALQSLRLDLPALQTRLRASMQAGSEYRGPYSREMVRALEQSMTEAADAHHRELMATDVLLGIMAHPDSSTSRVLTSFQLDLDTVRRAVEATRGGA